MALPVRAFFKSASDEYFCIRHHREGLRRNIAPREWADDCRITIGIVTAGSHPDTGD